MTENKTKLLCCKAKGIEGFITCNMEFISRTLYFEICVSRLLRTWNLSMLSMGVSLREALFTHISIILRPIAAYGTFQKWRCTP